VDGEEQLFYSGYLMRKVQVTELLQEALEAVEVESPDSVSRRVDVRQQPGISTWGGAAASSD
jgi:hypothetical protein